MKLSCSLQVSTSSLNSAGLAVGHLERSLAGDKLDVQLQILMNCYRSETSSRVLRWLDAPLEWIGFVGVAGMKQVLPGVSR